MALSARYWVFCNSATSRNVMIVVSVLMISCQVSTLSISRMDGAQIHTIRAHSAKNQAFATTLLTSLASRSNRVGPRWREFVRVALTLDHSLPVPFPEAIDEDCHI